MKNLYLLLVLAISFASYSQSGTLDPTFGNDGIVETAISSTANSATGVIVQPDGKIISTFYAEEPILDMAAVARYNTDGSLDDNFGTNGIVALQIGTNSAYAMDAALQPDGKIVIGAYSWDFNESTGDFILIRLLDDGTLDNSFGTDGKVVVDSGGSDVAAKIKVLANGKLLLVGKSQDKFSAARFNIDGTLDTTFGVNGWSLIGFPVGSVSAANAVAIQDDNKILLGGYIFDNTTYSNQVAAVRLNADGSPDESFGTEGKVNFMFGEYDDASDGIAVQSDGKIILGGSTMTDISFDFAAVRLNNDGSIDNRFGNNGLATAGIDGGIFNFARSMQLQSDDKIIISGLVNYGDTSDFAMIRFDKNGTIDNTFGNNGKVSTDIDGREDEVQAITLQQDNKIIVVGSSDLQSDVKKMIVARYDNIILGIEDFQNLEFSLYPNPAKEQLTIKLSDDSTNYQVSIFDILGKKVYSSEIHTVGNIDVSTYASGTYLVKLHSNNKTSVLRFVKQ